MMFDLIPSLQFVNITIKNPRTHIHRGKAQFTDYEINLQVMYPSAPVESAYRSNRSECKHIFLAHIFCSLVLRASSPIVSYGFVF